MSPEQAAGKDSDHRSDIYALGCILYEMATGQPPFVSDTFMGTLAKQMFETPAPPRELRPEAPLPQPVEDVILKMLAKEPARRQGSMWEVTTDLAAVLSPDRAPASTTVRGAVTDATERVAAEGATIPEPEAARRAGAHLRRRRIVGAVVASMALLALVVVGWFWLRSRQEPAGRREPTTWGTLILDTEPTGATISSGAQVLGRAPLYVRLPLGRRQVYVFRKAGYRDEVRQFAVDSSRRRRVVALERLGPDTPDAAAADGERPPSATDLRNPFRRLR
jgi:hypothetical protein